MTKFLWIFVPLFSSFAVIGALGVAVWERGQELKKAKEELALAQEAAEGTRGQMDELRGELVESQERADRLKEEKEAAAIAQKSLEQEMRSAMESKEVTISQLQGQLTVNILDRILFDSGDAVLKPEGEKILEQIAGVLAEYPNRQVHVIGHTDNVPIRPSAWSRYASNWELSTARATAAVRFLSERAGVDPHRLGALGYGEFHPLADNATAEGRAKNRRIALVVLPQVLTVLDVVTNAPADLKQAVVPVEIGGGGEAGATNAVAAPGDGGVTEESSP